MARRESRGNSIPSAGAPGVDSLLARHGGLSYLEIPAVDVRQSAAFYEAVIGWKVFGGDTSKIRKTGHS